MSSLIVPCTLNCTLCSSLGIYQGAEWSLPIRLSERANGQDTPIDISDFDGICCIKKYCGEDTPVASPLVTITNGANGEFMLSLTAEETANILVSGRQYKEVGVFQYDCYLISRTTGERFRVLQGNVEVSPAVVDMNDGE